ncbi:MAG: DUF3309 family protein [Acidobacteria bacterium]|nr:MAG: DUF3309 family protein [Acidobacteriota bacterium]
MITTILVVLLVLLLLGGIPTYRYRRRSLGRETGYNDPTYGPYYRRSRWSAAPAGVLAIVALVVLLIVLF